jgi:ketosteroid isomerase-like protein
MSPDQSALAVVHEVFRCFAGHDVPGLIALLDEEIEWHEPDVDVPWRGVHRNHDGFVSWLHIIGRELAIWSSNLMSSSPPTTRSWCSVMKVRG